MKILSAFALSAVVSLAGVSLIASASGDHVGSHVGSAKSSDAAMTEGEIRKVDKDAGKITIRHAELKNLDMPAMTMVFQGKEKSMLD